MYATFSQVDPPTNNQRVNNFLRGLKSDIRDAVAKYLREKKVYTEHFGRAGHGLQRDDQLSGKSL